MSAGPFVITGGAGFLGAALARQATAAGHDVVTVVRPVGDRQRRAVAGPRIVELDLDDARAADALAALAPSAIVHLAAILPQRGIDEIAAAAATTRMGANVIHAAARSSCRIVLAGSSHEYGFADGLLTEDAAPAATSPYGCAKRAITEFALSLQRSAALDAMVLRPFIVYGPGQDPHMFLPTVAQALARGERVPMNPGLHERDFVFVEDAARAFALAATVQSPAHRVLNVASGIAVTTLQAATTLATAMNRSELLAPGLLPYRPQDVPRHLGSPSRILETLGWQAGTTLEEGLGRMAEDALARWGAR